MRKAAGATPLWTTLSDDQLDREVRRDRPDASRVLTSYAASTVTNGFIAVTANDEIGRNATHHFDAFGREVLRARVPRAPARPIPPSPATGSAA
jgi:hypothetical protein